MITPTEKKNETNFNTFVIPESQTDSNLYHI